MSEIPFDEIQKYISDNCPYKGACFKELDDFTCPYEIQDGIPCRYMPELITRFKEIWEKKNEEI